MKPTFFFTSLLIFFFSFSLYSQSPEEISRRSTDIISIDSFEMLSTLTIYDARGNERERKISMAGRKFGDTHKTLMRFTAPPEVQGTSMLIHNHDNADSDMWIYMPAIRRVRRIAGDDKASNFMGSEFKNSDMTTPNTEDFNYRNLGTATIEGVICRKIEVLPKTSEIKSTYGFSKQISYIEKNTYFARKVEYYDFNGELERVQIISDYRPQPGGKYFAFLMEMENKQNGRRSVMQIDAFQPNSEMPESAFSPAMLEN